MERSKRNLILAATAIAVAATALVLVIVLSGDDEGSTPTATQPVATTTTETGKNSSKQGKKGNRGSSGKGTRTRDEREREQTGSIRQRIAGGGVETIRVQDGRPVQGLLRLIYRRDDRVRLKILSNRSERVFIPILGLSERVSPDEGAEFDFTATRSGLYGVELRRGKRRTRVAVLAIH